MLTSLGQGYGFAAEYYFQKAGWIAGVENDMFVV